MRVEVTFIPEQGIVKGRVTHVFAPLRERVDSLFVDAPGIHILSITFDSTYRVLSNGTLAERKHNADGILEKLMKPE